MIQTKSILLIIICSLLNFGQVKVPKQITDFDFNSRNPVFLQYPYNLPWYNDKSELFFEAVTDSFTSICSMKYNSETDSFYQLNYISSNSNQNSNIINRNANGKFIERFGGSSYKMLLWETNENGNWDIAFSIDSGNGWAPQELLFSSPDDELNPSFLLDSYINSYPELIYQRNNSIFLYTKSENEKNEMLFEGNDSVNYSTPTGAYAFGVICYVVAVEKTNSEEPHLVYRYRNYGDTLWSTKELVINNTPAINPKFNMVDFEMILSFEDISNGRKNNRLIRSYHFGIPGTAFSLIEDTTIETSEFSALTYAIITNKSTDDFHTYFPYTFRYRKNDSTFVRSGESGYYFYSDYYTRVVNSKPALGPLSLIWQGAVFYIIWEDSSNNRINLIGIKRIDPLGIVEDQSGTVAKFILSQNYPNPFNPSTTIRYQIPIMSFVTIKIYDVLGREIETLVNNFKDAGRYEVELNASTLPSGVYFYRIQAGDFIQTKKMILLK